MSCGRMFYVIIPSVPLTFTLLRVFYKQNFLDFLTLLLKYCLKHVHITHRLKSCDSLLVYIHCNKTNMLFQNASPYHKGLNILSYLVTYYYLFVQISIWRIKPQKPIGGNTHTTTFLKNYWDIYTSLFWTDIIPITSILSSYLICYNCPVKHIFSLGLPWNLFR